MTSVVTANFDTLYKQESNSFKDMPAWVIEEKNKSWQFFSKNGIPSRKNENWKYTNLNPISKNSFTLPKASSTDLSAVLTKETLTPYLLEEAINIPFVDGSLALDLNNLELETGVKIQTLSHACKENTEVLKKQFKAQKALLEKNKNSIIALNEALFKEGLYINVESEVLSSKTIHLIHFTSENSKLACFPYQVICLGKGAKASICETFISKTQDKETVLETFYNPLTYIHLAENASLNFYSLQKQKACTSHLNHTLVSQEKRSTFNSFSLSQGSSLSSHSIDVYQEGEAASSTLNGIFLGRDKQNCQQKTAIYHNKGFGTSRQFYKSLLADHARGVFLGKVAVAQDAQKVKSFQLNKNLLLSENAEIDTKPELEIDADDVKCAHGATVAQLREEELFYLKSRGIREEKAKSILSKAFIDEVLVLVEDPKINSLAAKLLSQNF